MDKLDLYVLDKNLRIIGLIDSYESVIWTDRYNEAGDFELYTYATVNIVELIQNGYYVRQLGSDRTMVIEKWGIETDYEEGDKIVVSGRSLECMLARRIFWGDATAKDAPQKIIKWMLENNFVNPYDPKRMMPNFVISDDEVEGHDEEIEVQYYGDNIYDSIVDICQGEEKPIGFKLLHDASGRMVFTLYGGTDRTTSQNAVTPVVFANEYQTLISFDYTFNAEEEHNVIMASGEGSGSERLSVGVYPTETEPIGIDRKEGFYDASDISKDDAGTTEAYLAQLQTKGKTALHDQQAQEEFDIQVDPYIQYTPNVDYFVGDIVDIISEYGITARARITEIIFNQDSSGYSVYPTLEIIKD